MKSLLHLAVIVTICASILPEILGAPAESGACKDKSSTPVDTE